MRTIFTILLFFVLRQAEAQTVAISYKKITINNGRFDTASRIAAYKKVLGMPDRKLHLANNIYVYDSLGIFIYEDYGHKNRIIQIGFLLKEDDEFNFLPRRTFNDSIFLSQYKYYISRNTTAAEVKHLCTVNDNSTLDLEDEDEYDFRYGVFHLFFEADKQKGTKILYVDF